MLTPQFTLALADELVVDLFAGGGGASTGIEQAIGRPVDIAVNHDPEAISLHEANHPQTQHYTCDVFEVDPIAVTAGRPIGLLWASPDCKHFSKAKGGKPVSKKIRSLAWIVVKWASLPEEVRPRIIHLENVEEFQTWGPLAKDGRPCPLRKGRTFARWKAALEGLGYVVEHRELRACDYGAPTIRKRLFVIARRDGLPIVWPAPTHGAPGTLPVRQRKLKAWRTAADCIDWSIPCPSIFTRKKPLADATCRRIAAGLVRFVLNAEKPFIVPLTHQGGNRGERALVVPTLVSMGHGEREGQAPRVPGLDKPLGTITAQGRHHALVTAFLAKHYTGVVGSSLGKPIGTVTSVDHHSLVAASLVHMGHGEGADGTKRWSHGVRDVALPLNTITASGVPAGVVHAFLVKFYSEGGQWAECGEPMHTIPTKDRFGLVTVEIEGETYAIVDIGLRMLTPRELYRAQGFPEKDQLESGANGKPLTKKAQVRMVGNSVCPPLARAIVAANYVERDAQLRAA